MRSDFWSLPYAARQAIRRGEGAEYEAQRLQAKVRRLERELAAANETIAGLQAKAPETGQRS